jgi:hypothetical protein
MSHFSRPLREENAMGDLDDVKAMNWFYAFDLPDGSKTSADYPDEILKIHTSRRDACGACWRPMFQIREI